MSLSQRLERHPLSNTLSLAAQLIVQIFTVGATISVSSYWVKRQIEESKRSQTLEVRNQLRLKVLHKQVELLASTQFILKRIGENSAAQLSQHLDPTIDITRCNKNAIRALAESTMPKYMAEEMMTVCENAYRIYILSLSESTRKCAKNLYETASSYVTESANATASIAFDEVDVYTRLILMEPHFPMHYLSVT